MLVVNKRVWLKTAFIITFQLPELFIRCLSEDLLSIDTASNLVCIQSTDRP
jgi:hypothetical protein